MSNTAVTETHGSDVDLLSSSKGLIKSLSEGVRNLLVLDEKLLTLGKNGDTTRTEVKVLAEITYKLVGKLEELDKRIGERFSELDKRLNEVDKRTALCVELEIRKQMDKGQISTLAKLTAKKSRDKNEMRVQPE